MVIKIDAIAKVKLPEPEPVATDSFRTATAIASTSSNNFVLDRGREPHVSQLDTRSGETVARFLPHIQSPHDTINPLGLGVLAQPSGSKLLVLDASKKRLISWSVGSSGVSDRVTTYSLRKAISESDNPASLATSRWGAGISGTMSNGTEVVYSPDLLHWQSWRDTTELRYGLPMESFLRSLATTNTLAMHPSEPLIVLASVYQPSFSIVNVRDGTMKRFIIDHVTSAPARLRLADDKSVRIAWDTATKRHFVSTAATTELIALLDCNCRHKIDRLSDRTVIWLFRWDGEPVARLLAPMPVSAIAFSDDSKSLLALVESGKWSRLFHWTIPTNMLAVSDEWRGTSGVIKTLRGVAP